MCLDMKNCLGENYLSDIRVETVSRLLLKYHAEFCILLCDAIMEKCVGNNGKAEELYHKFQRDFGKHEVEIERYYDQWLWMNYLKTNVFDREAKA